MNKEQQKLYDKLLKKVNEYCLGAAAEDVIEAIDNLVDEYEYPVDRSNTTKDNLKALEEIKMAEVDIGGGCLTRLYYTKQYSIVETALKETEKLRQINCELLEQKNTLREERDKYKKALEIIKNKKVNVRALIKSFYRPKDGLSVYNSQCCDWQEMESKELTQEEYDFLKEVCKNESTN